MGTKIYSTTFPVAVDGRLVCTDRDFAVELSTGSCVSIVRDGRCEGLIVDHNDPKVLLEFVRDRFAAPTFRASVSEEHGATDRDVPVR